MENITPIKTEVKSGNMLKTCMLGLVAAATLLPIATPAHAQAVSEQNAVNNGAVVGSTGVSVDQRINQRNQQKGQPDYFGGSGYKASSQDATNNGAVVDSHGVILDQNIDQQNRQKDKPGYYGWYGDKDKFSSQKATNNGAVVDSHGVILEQDIKQDSRQKDQRPTFLFPR